MGIYQNGPVACAGSFVPVNMFGNFKQINAFPAWFQSTPPERVGLNGEYDYYGLQKRVEATFSRYFTASQLEHLTVSQRGRVVILQGMVTDPAMLAKLTELAQQVEGAIRVETRWVSCEADVQNLFVAV